MTLQLHKKHRITQWNTLQLILHSGFPKRGTGTRLLVMESPSTCERATFFGQALSQFVVAAVVLSIVSGASCAFADTKSAAASDQPATAKQELSPLEKLKQRSPADRWKQSAKDVFSAPQPARASHGHSSPSGATSTDEPTKEPAATQNIVSQTQPVAAIGLKTQENASRPSPVSTRLLPTENGAGWFSKYITFQREETKQSPEPARDPKQLKKVTEIFPYREYEPNAETRDTDPCRNLCPRPDGQPCPTQPNSAIPTCPEEIQLSGEVYQGRRFTSRVYSWAASNVYHNPLYFEDVALERYGHTHHELIQPFVSVGKFGIQLVGLPYQMTIDPIRKKMYPLGWYRPGECAPKKFHLIPWNAEAALREAGVWTALIFIFP